MQSGGEQPLHGFIVPNPINLSFAGVRLQRSGGQNDGSTPAAAAEAHPTSKIIPVVECWRMLVSKFNN